MTLTWTILSIVAVILLILNWNKNVVWGSFTLGIIISLVASIFVGFEWVFLAKGGIIGAIFGQILNFIPTNNNVS
jgi:hypothetical protein